MPVRFFIRNGQISSMKRSVFIRNILTAGSLTAIPGLIKATPFDSRLMKKAPKCIKPPRLKQGDIVGLLAPASPFSEEKFQRAVQQIENMGLKVQLAPRLRERNGYLAGTDEDRQNDLHEFFQDPKVKGLWVYSRRLWLGAATSYSGLSLDQKKPETTYWL